MADGDRLGTIPGAIVPNSANAPSPDPPTNVRFLVLSLACAISFVLYLHRYVWGFVKHDVQREFGWNAATLGQMDSVFFLSYAFGQVPSGILCDWFGARLLLGSSIILWSLALAGLAIAIGFTSMAAARLSLGITQAGGYPVLNKVSKNWFPVGMRTTAQGLIATGFGRAGGGASFFLFGSVLIGWLGLSWRAAVGVFTVLGIIVGVAFIVLFRNTPREHPWSNSAESELVTATDHAAAVATHTRLRWSSLLSSRAVWLLCFSSFLSNMADILFVNWVPLYLRGARGFSPSAAGWLSALPLAGGALGGVLSGAAQSYLIARIGSRRWTRVALGCSGKVLAGTLMAASLTLESAVAIGCLFLAVKFCSDWEQPAQWGAMSDIAGHNAATVFASVNTVGAFGAITSSLLTGSLLDRFSVAGRPSPAGWNTVFLLIACESMAAGACWLFINCDRPLEHSDAAQGAGLKS